MYCQEGHELQLWHAVSEPEPHVRLTYLPAPHVPQLWHAVSPPTPHTLLVKKLAPQVLHGAQTVSLVPPHRLASYWLVPHALHAAHWHPGVTNWFAGQLVRGHAPHTVFRPVVQAAFKKVPFVQLEQLAQTVLFLPAHAALVYCPPGHAAQAVQAHPELTYWFAGQPLRAHPPHTVSLVPVHAAFVNVPFPHRLQFLHSRSPPAVHGLEAYCPGPHAVQLTHWHPLLTYWFDGHPLSRHGPHTVFCPPLHAAFANVPFPHTLHSAHEASLYG